MNEDRATRYHRLKRQVSIISLVWGVSLLLALLTTGWSVAIRSYAVSASARIAPVSLTAAMSAALYVLLLLLINELAGLPLAFYSGFVLERRYGLSTERLSVWLLDQLKSFGIGLLFAWGAAAIVYS